MQPNQRLGYHNLADGAPRAKNLNRNSIIYCVVGCIAIISGFIERVNTHGISLIYSEQIGDYLNTGDPSSLTSLKTFYRRQDWSQDNPVKLSCCSIQNRLDSFVWEKL